MKIVFWKVDTLHYGIMVMVSDQIIMQNLKNSGPVYTDFYMSDYVVLDLRWG